MSKTDLVEAIKEASRAMVTEIHRYDVQRLNERGAQFVDLEGPTKGSPARRRLGVRF